MHLRPLSPLVAFSQSRSVRSRRRCGRPGEVALSIHGNTNRMTFTGRTNKTGKTLLYAFSPSESDSRPLSICCDAACWGCSFPRAGVLVTPESISRRDVGSLLGHNPLNPLRTVSHVSFGRDRSGTGQLLTSLDECRKVSIRV